MSQHPHEPTTTEHAMLRAALQNLPAHAPDSDTWARIRARAVTRQHTRRRLRRWLPPSAAAAVLLALGLIGALQPTRTLTSNNVATSDPSPATGPRKAQAAPTLTALQNHSMRLEQWLNQLRSDGAPLQGRALASAVMLQDRISLIDLQLAAPGPASQRKPLWQRRIALLQDLAMLRVSQSPLPDRPVMAESRNTTYHL